MAYVDSRLATMPKRADIPPQEAGFMRRIGSRAGFGVAAIGLVFAAYQVQGWTMPHLLAAALIVLLLAVAAIALLSIAWEAIKEARSWRERHETSTAWIAAEPPGMLDYIPDMNRATKKFVHQMNRLNHDTEKLGKKTARHARVIKWVTPFGPRATQLWANHTAKGISRSAMFIEKRSTHLRKTVDELGRTQEGYLNGLDAPKSEEDRAALAGMGDATAGRSASTGEAIESVIGYRDASLGLSQQNVSRTLTVANKQLAHQLDAVIVVLRRSLKDSERLEALLKRKAGS